MSNRINARVVALTLCTGAASLLLAAKLGFLTDRGGKLVLAILGIILAAFSRPIAAWSHSVGERHSFLSHWQQIRPVFVLVVGVALAIFGGLFAFI